MIECEGDNSIGVYLQEDVQAWKNQISMFIPTLALSEIISKYIFTDAIPDDAISTSFPWMTVHNQVFQIPSRILAKLYTSNQVIQATIIRPPSCHDADNKENRFQMKILSNMECDGIHSLVQAYFFLLNKVFHFHEVYGPISEWFADGGYGVIGVEDDSGSGRFMNHLTKEPDYDDSTGLYLLNGKKYGIFNCVAETYNAACNPYDCKRSEMVSILKDGSHYYEFIQEKFTLTIRLVPSRNIKSYLSKQFDVQMSELGLEDDGPTDTFTERWNTTVANFLENGMDPQPDDHEHNARATKQRKLPEHKDNTRATKRSKPSVQ